MGAGVVVVCDVLLRAKSGRLENKVHPRGGNWGEGCFLSALPLTFSRSSFTFGGEEETATVFTCHAPAPRAILLARLYPFIPLLSVCLSPSHPPARQK